MVLTHPILPTLHDAPLPVLLVALIVYLAPSVAARTVSCKRLRPVLAINLLLGWTLVGWMLSLAMALGRGQPTKRPDATTHPHGVGGPR